MAYTQEQIDLVCQKVSDEVLKHTVEQNALFTTTPLRKGMEEGKEYEELVLDLYESINQLPVDPRMTTGTLSMVNICQIASGALHEALESLEAEPAKGTDEQNDPEQQGDN